MVPQVVVVQCPECESQRYNDLGQCERCAGAGWIQKRRSDLTKGDRVLRLKPDGYSKVYRHGKRL